MSDLKCDRCGEMRPMSHGSLHACEDGGFGKLLAEVDQLNFEELMAKPAIVISTGNTYEHRDFLSLHGFSWNPTEKHWFQTAEDADIDALCERVKANCPGVRFEVRA